jgi:RNA polymerase sigma factor (sigma-70 family)
MGGGVAPRPADEATEEAAAAGEARLVARHLGLVRTVVRRMRGRVTVGFDVDDMTQEGLIGLLRAARRWDPGRGLKFSSLAVPCIRGAISTAWTTGAERIRVPAGARRRAVAAGAGVGADAGARAGLDGVGWEGRCVSLDTPLAGEGSRTMGDVVADERAVDPAAAAELADRACRLIEALAHLDPLERAVLVHRYGLVGEPLTWPQLAERLGISSGHARRIEAAALASLREVPSLAA